LRVLAALLLVAVVVGLGTAIYNQGVTTGLAEAAREAAASGDPVPVNPYAYGWGGPYAGGPWGWGFGGFFGLLFGIFMIFLVIGLIRAAFGGWRGGGPDGWGRRHERVAEWHRELHRREGATGEHGTSGA